MQRIGTIPHHLQQNYIMGFVFTNADGTLSLELTEDWYDDLSQTFYAINPQDAVNELDMQEDIRNIISKQN